MKSIEDINNFLIETQSIKKEDINPDSDLCLDLGIEGDDFFELEEALKNEFNINMASYKWYFHHGEDGFINPGALLFKPPYKRVKHIAVTPSLLLEAANKGIWPIKYSSHILPTKRYDIISTYIIFITFFGFVFYATLA